MKVVFNPFTGKLDLTGNSGPLTPTWSDGYPTYDLRYLKLDGSNSPLTGNVAISDTFGFTSTNVYTKYNYEDSWWGLSAYLTKYEDASNKSFIALDAGTGQIYITDNTDTRYGSITSSLTESTVTSYDGNTFNSGSLYVSNETSVNLGASNSDTEKLSLVRLLYTGGISLRTNFFDDYNAILKTTLLTENKDFEFPNAGGILLVDTIADSTYLKLNGSNSPMTGNISFASGAKLIGSFTDGPLSYTNEIRLSGPSYEPGPSGLELISTSTFAPWINSIGRLLIGASYSRLSTKESSLQQFTEIYTTYQTAGLKSTDSINSNIAFIEADSNLGLIRLVGNSNSHTLFNTALISTNLLTGNRTYQPPDASGTFLLDTTFSTVLDGTYAKLDGSNQPFTGNVGILNSGARLFNIESTDNTASIILKGTNGYIYTYNTAGTLISTYDNGSITRSGQLNLISSSSAVLLQRTGLSSIRIATDIEANLSSEFLFRNSGGTVTYVAIQQGANINNLRVTHSLKIGDTTQTATSATFGSIKASVNQYYGVVPNTTTPTWEKFAFVGMDKNITTVATGTYNILSTDNILDITVVCSATLPTITADLVGKEIQIYGENIPVTINRGGADLIEGDVAINMVGYSVRTLKAMKLGVWRVK